MLPIADRTELSGRLCAKPLAMQATRYSFNVVRREFVRKSRCTIPLFCICERPENIGITGQTKLLSPAYLKMPGALGIPAAASNSQHPTHGFNAELSLMFFDKDMLHFRRFAKYVAAFWRMASSSSCSAS